MTKESLTGESDFFNRLRTKLAAAFVPPLMKLVNYLEAGQGLHVSPEKLADAGNTSEAPLVPDIPDEFIDFIPLIERHLGKDSTGHDVDHTLRVFHTALKLQEIEGGNRFVIGLAALCHDMLRPWEKEQADNKIKKEDRKTHFSPEALEIIRTELLNLQVHEEIIEQVLQIIAEHEIYGDIPGQSIESMILQDADRLDAIGAFGIARVFIFAGAYGDKIAVPGEALPKGGFKENQTTKGGSVLRHFYTKLFGLSGMMHTETAVRMAIERDKLMLALVQELFLEMAGAA